MERQQREAREALDVVAQTREVNAERLRRPRWYWFMVGGFLAVFGLLPLTADWPPLVRFVLPPALMIVIAVFAAWRQPTAVRKLELRGRMWLPLLGSALAAALVQGLNMALFASHGWWWLPPLTALVLFTGTILAGPAIDRSWARTVSSVER